MLLASTFLARATAPSEERAPLHQSKSLVRALCALFWPNSLRGRRQPFLDPGENCLWSPGSWPETCPETQHLLLVSPPLIPAWLCLDKRLNSKNKVKIPPPPRLAYLSPSGCPFPPTSEVCVQPGAIWIGDFVFLATQNLPRWVLEPIGVLIPREIKVGGYFIVD